MLKHLYTNTGVCARGCGDNENFQFARNYREHRLTSYAEKGLKQSGHVDEDELTGDVLVLFVCTVHACSWVRVRVCVRVCMFVGVYICAC